MFQAINFFVGHIKAPIFIRFGERVLFQFSPQFQKSFNTDKIREGAGKVFSFFKQKKIINTIIILLFLVLLIGSSMIRFQNLPLLKDSTNGEYIPLALDPFYFLRLAETIVEQGGLPEVDVMRYPSANIGFSNEILPQAIVLLFRIGKIFDGDITIQFIDVISPVIFFAMGLIAFFFLVYVLTNSKATALISSGFLAFMPPYLHRTLAGFSDHESLGMFAFFLVLLFYGLSLKFLGKQNRDNSKIIKSISWGLLIGFLSAFTIASWGGIGNFLFMIIPFSFVMFWLIKVQNTENVKKEQLKSFLIFYFVWLISSILFGLFYGFSLQNMLSKVVLSSTSLISGAVLLFIFADFLIITLKNKINFIKKENLEKYRILYSLLIVFVIGIIFITLYRGNPFSYFFDILGRFLDPFGAGRTGLTVAENRQPFLNEWIAQIGKVFFWIFYLGIIFVGFGISRGIGKNKNKILFVLLWAAMISGILFSKISPSSLFNGTNFASQFIYFGGLLLFFAYSLWLYFNDKIKIGSGLLIIVAWLFFMLIAGRGAARLLFVITPFAAFMGGYAIVKLFNYTKRNKDDFLKMILWIVFAIILIAAIFNFNNFVDITSAQAKSTGPSAGSQWQNAMFWVRENTAKNSIFVHWWDYGYWVEYLGERPSVTDGGHGVGYWDHLIGRYLLTTPEPKTALSFMKSHDVSYLLIDPTDLGKYPAYSTIGSGPKGKDRLSQIPIMLLDLNQVRETSEEEIRLYVGGTIVDEDIIYEENGQQIFLPANKAALAGTTVKFSRNANQITFNSIDAIFIYNNQQVIVPIRYIYFRGELADFGSGLEAVVRFIPRATQSGQNLQIDNLGTAIYLSPKVSKSLFAQLYLMDDPFENYPTVTSAHSEMDPLISSLNLQGAGIEDFLFFGGFRGPIKIWKIDYPDNTLEKEEFLRRSGDFAEFDNLEFLKK